MLSMSKGQLILTQTGREPATCSQVPGELICSHSNAPVFTFLVHGMNCSLQMPVTFRSPCFFHSHFMTLDQAKDSITTSVELGERAAVGSPAEGAEQREEIRIHS